jgi:hypothetical protein
MTDVAQIQSELADREAIKECLYRYSRGTDRCDPDILRTAFWPDAIISHLRLKEINIEEFIANHREFVKAMSNHQHHITNMIINLDGSTAKVESYFWSCALLGADDRWDRIGGGRYLDKLERRGGEWRIRERFVMSDWFRQFDDGCDFASARLGTPPEAIGKGNREDPSYTWLGIA